MKKARKIVFHHHRFQTCLPRTIFNVSDQIIKHKAWKVTTHCHQTFQKAHQPCEELRLLATSITKQTPNKNPQQTAYDNFRVPLYSEDSLSDIDSPFNEEATSIRQRYNITRRIQQAVGRIQLRFPTAFRDGR